MIKIFIFAICCILGSVSEFDPEEHEGWNLLPHDICGKVNSDRIVGGTEPPMNSYPWLARIGYLSSDLKKIYFRCGGVVVNSKTVLTAGHCVFSPSKKSKVAVIRFGEHNTETNPDCEGDFCAAPVLDIAPSEILIPKCYNSPYYKHDIALVRLKSEIIFSAFVKPICLPGGEFLKKNFIGTIAEVAGWGVYDIDDPKSSIKLQFVKLPVLENEECAKHLPFYVSIGSTQICAGGVNGKDSCNGDSGGPLMKIDDGTDGPRYYLLGIVSFGPKKCGKDSMPGVYTKMAAYMEWFLNNLEKRANDSCSVL